MGVAELNGDDVLEEIADGLGVADIAGEREDFGVGKEEVAPVEGGGVVPAEEVVGGDGEGHGG